MELVTHPLKCKKGSKFQFFFTWKVKNNAGVWEPVNLTGYTARLVVRKDYNTATPLAELTTQNGRITLGGTAGTINCQLPSSVTGALATGVWLYDFDIIDPSGEPDRMLEGPFEVVQ